MNRPFLILFTMAGALADLGLWSLFVAFVDRPAWYLLLAAAVLGVLWPYWGSRFIAADIQAEQGRAMREWSDGGYVRQEEVLQRVITHPDGRVERIDLRGPFNRHRSWTWHDRNGNGRVDPGEMEPPRAGTTFVSNGLVEQRPALAALTPGQRARLLLAWSYDRAAQGLGYGQEQRAGEWSRRHYDEGMAILVHAGLVYGRGRQGVKGELVVVPASSGMDWASCRQAAFRMFDHQVVDD